MKYYFQVYLLNVDNSWPRVVFHPKTYQYFILLVKRAQKYAKNMLTDLKKLTSNQNHEYAKRLIIYCTLLSL